MPDKDTTSWTNFKPNLAFISSMVEAKELMNFEKYELSIILIVGSLETFLKDRLIEVIDSKSKYAVGEYAIRKWSFENMDRAYEAYKTLIDFDLKKIIKERRGSEVTEYFNFLREICYIRHILVHNGGIIDEKGAKNLNLKNSVGQIIKVDKEFSEKAYEAVAIFAVMIDDEFNADRFITLDLRSIEHNMLSKKQLFKNLTDNDYEELQFKGININILKPIPVVCSRCLTENVGAICSKCGLVLCEDNILYRVL